MIDRRKDECSIERKNIAELKSRRQFQILVGRQFNPWPLDIKDNSVFQAWFLAFKIAKSAFWENKKEI